MSLLNEGMTTETEPRCKVCGGETESATMHLTDLPQHDLKKGPQPPRLDMTLQAVRCADEKCEGATPKSRSRSPPVIGSGTRRPSSPSGPRRRADTHMDVPRLPSFRC